jgi:anthranilate synthase component 2
VDSGQRELDAPATGASATGRAGDRRQSHGVAGGGRHGSDIAARQGIMGAPAAAPAADFAMLLMIDNYDSFTFNLVQYLQTLGAEVRVVRNDAMTVAEIDALSPERIMISPGPGTPDQAGVSLDVIRELGPRIPVFGVCLGHQSLGQAYGGDVVRAKTIMHGKTSRIRHTGHGVFAGLPDGYEATRYHSLVVAQDTLPECLEVTAWTENADGSIDEIMGLRHKSHPVEGVQFHPESILTEHGHALLKNFLEG